MPRGGVRPGAGRKPRAEKYARPIASAEKRIADRLPDLVDKLFELAEGVEVQDKGKVYCTPPDFRAASYLVDRILGKPTQAVDAAVSGPNGGPQVIRVLWGDADEDDSLTTPAPGAEGGS